MDDASLRQAFLDALDHIALDNQIDSYLAFKVVQARIALCQDHKLNAALNRVQEALEARESTSLEMFLANRLRSQRLYQ